MKLQVKRTAIVIMLCIAGWFTLPLNSQTNPSRSTQQLILDKLANIEARLMVVENTQKMILREMDKRFEQVDKRFEQVDNRFSDMMNYIIIMAVVFASMTGLTIGFALWDRRTMIRPFESKVKEIETNINENQEKLDKAQNLNNQLISVIRDYAKKDRKFAEIIKGYNIF
jgi:predicted PurR-regulated permease PerM